MSNTVEQGRCDSEVPEKNQQLPEQSDRRELFRGNGGGIEECEQEKTRSEYSSLEQTTLRRIAQQNPDLPEAEVWTRALMEVVSQSTHPYIKAWGYLQASKIVLEKPDELVRLAMGSLSSSDLFEKICAAIFLAEEKSLPPEGLDFLVTIVTDAKYRKSESEFPIRAADVRGLSIRGLAVIGEKAATPAVLADFKKELFEAADPDRVSTALARMGRTGADLLLIAVQDGNEHTRNSALRAIINMPTSSLPQGQTKTVLLHALEDSDSTIPLWAADALSLHCTMDQGETAKVFAVVKGLFNKSVDREYTNPCHEGLVGLRLNMREMQPLVEGYVAKSDVNGDAFFLTMSRDAKPCDLVAFRKLLQSENQCVRTGAAYNITELDPHAEEVIPHLLNGLGKMQCAGNGLIALGSSAVPALEKALHNNDVEVRHQIILIIRDGASKFGRKSETLLRLALSDASEENVLSAVDSYFYLPGSFQTSSGFSAIQGVLRKYLADPSHEQYLWALKQFGKIPKTKQDMAIMSSVETELRRRIFDKKLSEQDRGILLDLVYESLDPVDAKLYLQQIAQDATDPMQQTSRMILEKLEEHESLKKK